MWFFRSCGLRSSRAEDNQLVRNVGFEVDDDNDPAEENYPQDTEEPQLDQTWGWTLEKTTAAIARKI